MKKTKHSLITSLLALLLCFSMLLGTTYAWFTDSVTSTGNKIIAGNLKLDLEVLDQTSNRWNSIKESKEPLFDYDKWEPGYTAVTILKIENEGNLALKWFAKFVSEQELSPLADVIDVYVLAGTTEIGYPTDRNLSGYTKVGTAKQFINSIEETTNGILYPAGSTEGASTSYLGIALKMRETAGNEYQNMSLGGAFDIQILATQVSYESDSFDNTYDSNSEYPVLATQIKHLPDGAASLGFELSYEGDTIAELNIPADAIADPTKPVTVSFTDMDPKETIVVDNNTKAIAYDIEVSNLKTGLTGDQRITVTLQLPNALPAAKVYHNGEEITDAVYDEITGTISFKTASFSPYAITYKEYEVATVEALREAAVVDGANIKLTADLVINLDPNAADNDCDPNHFCKLTGSYEYYNVVNVNGENIALDLNGHSITVSGNKTGDTVGAVFFIMPNSNLNITDSKGGGVVRLADPAYLVWAPYDAEYGLSYVDVYGGIFAAHSYADDARTPGYFAMFYAGEGGKIDVRGGYYLYDNESYVRNGKTYENVNNGGFNVMNSVTTPCITIHDGVSLINQYYRQDGYNANNKEADHDSIFLAEDCELVKISKAVAVGNKTYSAWYQVQTSNPTKFETKFEYTDAYVYRVGNKNAVALGSLFVSENTIKTGTKVDVKVTALNNAGVSCDYTANTDDWTKGTLKFEGTGRVDVTIGECTLRLEIVDALNATSAMNATSSNVVLLNNAGFSSLEVSGGYTLYGNGFTLTCGSDAVAKDFGYSFVTLDNGTLDNVQIVCPNFDYAALYKSNLTSGDNRSHTENGTTRYYNARSAVMVSGNSQILNSRISGARAAVNVAGGNCVIDNSRIELGAVASLLVGSANSVTLRDVTLVQKPTASTYDSSKVLMGFSVLFICDADGNTAPVTLEGTLVQNAWVDKDDKQYVPSAGQSVINTVLSKTDYLHDINGDGTNESLNLGFAYMPESSTGTAKTPTITDNRTNKNSVPYGGAEVSIITAKAYVYSYKNSNGTADTFKNEAEYKPNKQGDIITVTYSDTADGLEAGKSFGTNGWVYELNVDLDKVSGYKLNFSKLSMSVNGVTVTDFKVNGAAKPTSPVAVTAGGVTYTLTATIDGKEYIATYKVTGTETSKESPSLVAANYEAGLCVASSYGGTWHGAVPALEGIQIKYWSVAEKQYKTINLADYTPTTAGKQNGTNKTWTFSPTNGDFTITLTGGQVHSSNNVYAMPVVCNGKLYFVAADSKGLVNSGNSARSISVSYSFKDNNNGDELTFSHSWSVAENKDAQYKYSDFCNGTLTKLTSGSSGGSCVTPDTLITLANGTQVRVDSLTGNEELLVWNLETGKLDKAPIMFVDSDPATETEVITLTFSDGTSVKVIYEHGFWDYDLNRYVYLDENADEYVGHTFAKMDGDTLTKVKLTKVETATELTMAWSPVTVGHLCYFVNGMLSMPGGVGGLFNIFEVDPDTMAYDFAQIEKDIETYGLYTYEELNAICPLSEDMFNAAGGAYLKISIAKGNLTEQELFDMIHRYSKFFN